MKSIVEFFDPSNVEHLKEYQKLYKTGVWSEEFIKDLDIPQGWFGLILDKIANYYVTTTIKNRESK